MRNMKVWHVPIHLGGNELLVSFGLCAVFDPPKEQHGGTDRPQYKIQGSRRCADCVVPFGSASGTNECSISGGRLTVESIFLQAREPCESARVHLFHFIRRRVAPFKIECFRVQESEATKPFGRQHNDRFLLPSFIASHLLGRTISGSSLAGFVQSLLFAEATHPQQSTRCVKLLVHSFILVHCILINLIIIMSELISTILQPAISNPPLGVVVVMLTTLALLLVGGYWILLHGNHKHNKNRPPRSQTGMWATLSQFASPRLPWFFLQQAEAVDFCPVFQLNLPVPQGVYVVTNATVARQILTHPSSEKTGSFANHASPISGNVNLLRSLTHSHYWKQVRKGVAPAFSSRQVQRMNAICRHMVEDWIATTLEPLVDSGGTLDPARGMTRLTTRVICQAAFEYTASDSEISNFLQHIEVALREFLQKQQGNQLRRTAVAKWLVPSVQQAHASAQAIRAFAQTMLNAYRRNHPNDDYTGDPQCHSVMRLLVETLDLSEPDRIGEIVTFLVGGYDTTGYTLGSALTLVAQHPHVATELQAQLQQAEAKVIQQLDHQNKKHDKKDDERDAKIRSAWAHCDYLHYVIRETFRLYPVAALGATFRRLDHDFVVPLEEQPPPQPQPDETTKKDDSSTTTTRMIIPKGAMIATPQIIIHRNPRVFGPTANHYQPHRWATATPDMVHSLLTFSIGSRTCVAQALATAEIQSVLPRLLRHYRFSVVEPGQPDFFLSLKIANCKLSVKRVTDAE